MGRIDLRLVATAVRRRADEADLGTVEVGKLADLIVVREDPLEDIHNLRSLQLVLKEGRVVADHRDRG